MLFPISTCVFEISCIWRKSFANTFLCRSKRSYAVAPVVSSHVRRRQILFLLFYLAILDSCTSRCLIEADVIRDSSMKTSSLRKITKYAGGEDSRGQVIFGEEINEKTRAPLSKLPEQSSRVGPLLFSSIVLCLPQFSFLLFIFFFYLRRSNCTGRFGFFDAAPTSLTPISSTPVPSTFFICSVNRTQRTNKFDGIAN